MNIRSPTIMRSESLAGWGPGFVSVSPGETVGGDKGRGEVGLGAGNEAKYARMPFMHAYDGLGDACLRTGTHRWCDTDSACGRRGARQFFFLVCVTI